MTVASTERRGANVFRTLETLQPYNREPASIFAVRYGFQPRFQEWFHGFTGFLVSLVSQVHYYLRRDGLLKEESSDIAEERYAG